MASSPQQLFFLYSSIDLVFAPVHFDTGRSAAKQDFSANRCDSWDRPVCGQIEHSAAHVQVSWIRLALRFLSKNGHRNSFAGRPVSTASNQTTQTTACILRF
jgi:hypothetical protein